VSESTDRSEIVARFHRLYYDGHATTWEDTRWLGTRVLKCPLDLWIYQEILARVRPALVVETGTFAGGSALFLATCMDALGHGRVLTIDVEEHAGRPVHQRITYLVGSSVDDDTVRRVYREADGVSPAMVVLDSDHARDHVLAELRLYAPLVTPGSYLVVEDTNVNGHPVYPDFGPGPHEAVEQFVRREPGFARDPSCEKFLMTFNPGGYLERQVTG
jgi:cephalosporin hydroxylase